MSSGWEDFPIGRVIETPSVTVTESHVVQFANLTGDWYPLHMDAEWAGHSGFGKRIAHGPLLFSLGVGLMYQSQCFGSSIIAWLGANNVRATAPVFFGDTVRVVATVTGARASREEARGIVTLLYDIRKQGERSVMSYDFLLLMHSTRAGPAAAG